MANGNTLANVLLSGLQIQKICKPCKAVLRQGLKTQGEGRGEILLALLVPGEVKTPKMLYCLF